MNSDKYKEVSNNGLFVRFDKNVKFPLKKYCGDAGFDCFLPEQVCIPAHGVKAIDLKISTNLKFNEECAIVCARSSIAKCNVIVNTSPIDSTYSGNIHAIVHNLNSHEVVFDKDERICQIVILKIRSCLEGLNAIRGDNGFGSSGK